MNIPGVEAQAYHGVPWPLVRSGRSRSGLRSDLRGVLKHVCFKLFFSKKICFFPNKTKKQLQRSFEKISGLKIYGKLGGAVGARKFFGQLFYFLFFLVLFWLNQKNTCFVFLGFMTKKH